MQTNKGPGGIALLLVLGRTADPNPQRWILIEKAGHQSRAQEFMSRLKEMLRRHQLLHLDQRQLALDLPSLVRQESSVLPSKLLPSQPQQHQSRRFHKSSMLLQRGIFLRKTVPRRESLPARHLLSPHRPGSGWTLGTRLQTAPR